MRLRELINRLEGLSHNGENDNVEIVTRDTHTHIFSDIVFLDEYVNGNGNCIFEIVVE